MRHNQETIEACAAAVGTTNVALSEQLVSRARRVGENVRRTHQEASAVRALELGSPKQAFGVSSTPNMEREEQAAQALLTNCLASTADLAYSPLLLASELIAAINLLGCSSQVTVEEQDCGVEIRHADAGSIALGLGKSRGKALALACSIPSGSDAVRALELGSPKQAFGGEHGARRTSCPGSTHELPR